MVGLWLVIQMAGYAMPRGRLAQEWLGLCTYWHSLGTPGVKAAPAGGIEWTRYLTRQNHLSMYVIGMGWERIAQQHLGIRMQRVGIEFHAGRSLDQLAEVHDTDLVTDIFDDGQIMGNKYVAHT